jgi:hypothetical protein
MKQNLMAWVALAGLGPMASAAAAGADPIHLQALVPTSGESAAVLLDGDRESGWSPTGDPAGEGVLLRFEAPVQIDRVEVLLCPGSGLFELAPYVNGAAVVARTKGKDREEYFFTPPGRGPKVRSVFLRIASAEGVPCIGLVRFVRGKETLAVAPPRTKTGTVEASSTLTPIDAYHASYLFDGRTDFGWVEGAKGLGQGESVSVQLDAPMELVALELWNGYQRSPDHFKKNARATRIQVQLDAGEPLTLKVKDSMGPQKLALPKPVKTKRVKLTVLQARKGTRYPDLVLSELRLWDRKGPWTVRTPDQAERREVLEQEIAASPLADVVDRQWFSLCGDQRVSRLKLRTNHTFVWYVDAEQAGETETRSQSEVFDGAWVVGKAQPPSASIDLFGRRHKTSAVFDPYAGNKVRDTVQIGGGNVAVTRLSDVDGEQFTKLIRQWAKSPARDRIACLDLSVGGIAATFEALQQQGAILLTGKAMTDLMIHQGR